MKKYRRTKKTHFKKKRDTPFSFPWNTPQSKWIAHGGSALARRMLVQRDEDTNADYRNETRFLFSISVCFDSNLSIKWKILEIIGLFGDNETLKQSGCYFINSFVAATIEACRLCMSANFRCIGIIFKHLGLMAEPGASFDVKYCEFVGQKYMYCVNFRSKILTPNSLRVDSLQNVWTGPKMACKHAQLPVCFSRCFFITVLRKVRETKKEMNA